MSCTYSERERERERERETETETETETERKVPITKSTNIRNEKVCTHE